MGEAAKKINLASLKDQSCHVFGDAAGLDLKLGISNIYSAQARDHTFNHVEKNLIHGSSSNAAAAAGVTNLINTNLTVKKRQASKPSLSRKLAKKKEDSKKLRRIMSNRLSARRYRQKKLNRMRQLEKQITALEEQVSNLHRQIAEAKNKQQILMIEQQHLKFKIAAVHSHKIVSEGEIARNMAEVTRLRELQLKQFQAQHAIRKSDDGHQVKAPLDLNLGL